MQRPSASDLTTQHIDVRLLVGVPVSVSGITAVNACILFGEVGDCDGVKSNSSARVGGGVVQGRAVVGPLDARLGDARRITEELRRVPLRFVL